MLPRDTLHIVRTVYLWNGAAHQRLKIVQSRRGAGTISLLALLFGNDFADLFEVRGQRRQRRGRLRELARSASDVSFIYSGLDGAKRRTELVSILRRASCPRLLPPTA